MKLRVKLALAASIGLVGAATSSLQAQIPGADAAQNPLNGEGVLSTMTSGGLQQFRIPPQGTWAEVIHVTSKWMVVQNQAGQQFPIPSDRVRQFLVRWPYSVSQLSPRALVEVAGPSAGSNTIIADHIDVYEGDAQNMVSPGVSDLYGFSRQLNPIDVNEVNTYGLIFYMSPEEYSLPARSHAVGRPVGGGEGEPIRIEGTGQNWVNIQPSVNGMTATQVTRGNNSYAQRGDTVYLIPENIAPRGIDVSEMVLYKRIPLRNYQP